MKIEDLEIHLLSDGLAMVDAGGPFGLVPRVLYSRYLPPDDANRVPQALTCMLLRSEGKTVLIDTGLGPKLSDNELDRWALDRTAGDLDAGLARLGLSPGEVDIVIDTHLHWDHCGGNTVQGERGLQPHFPNAQYLVQRTEWVEASHPDARTRGTYFPENFAPLLADGRLRLLQGDEQVTKHIRCVVTPGHTRAHQSVMLQAGDWHGLYVADMASYAIHMAKTAWLTAYDVLPRENIRTKERWQRWALEQDARLFFEHDPYMPVGVLRVDDRGRLEIQPAAEAAELTDAIPTPQPPAG